MAGLLSVPVCASTGRCGAKGLRVPPPPRLRRTSRNSSNGRDLGLFPSSQTPSLPDAVRVLTVSGAAGAEANSCRFTQPLWDGCGKKSVVDLELPAEKAVYIKAEDMASQWPEFKTAPTPKQDPLNHGPARGTAHRSSERSRSGMPNSVLGYRFCRSARTPINPASQGRQPTPGE
jgi:hypothetical protein